MIIKRGTAIVAVMAALGSFPAVANAATDVPKGDWSYNAIQDLANKGLVDGYGKKADLFANRTVNRYEMAALVGRVVAKLAADQTDPTAAKPAPATLEEAGKLIQEYGVELAVLGVDVSNLKLGLQALTDTVQDQNAAITKMQKNKVETKVGKVAFSGLLQEWYQAGSKTPSTFRIRRAELKFSGNITPSAYFLAMFDPSKNLAVTSTSSAVPAGGGTPTITNTVNEAGVPLQDLVLGYHWTPLIDVEIGQQKVPMSIEGYRSSTNLLTVERSLFNTVGFNNGRVGDIRDLGVWARYNDPLNWKPGNIYQGAAVWNGTAAVLDDGGNRQNNVDDNNGKEIFLNGQYVGITGLEVGGYGEISGGVNAKSYTQRRRIGADFDWVKAQHELTGEYVEGYDGNGSGSTTIAGTATTGGKGRLRTQGAYLTYGYKLNARWQAVAREDYFNPDRDLRGALANRENDLTLGLNYFLLGNNAKIQFNYVNKSIKGPATNSPAASAGLGTSRGQYTVAVQQTF